MRQQWIESRKTICIDFNGVLDTYKGWTGDAAAYPMRDGTVEFLDALIQAGYTIIIFTAADVSRVKQWVIRNGLDDLIADVTNVKVPALCYVDDRAVRFNGDFYETFEEIMEFKTFWEDKDHQEGGKV
jgi:hypothetical protein